MTQTLLPAPWLPLEGAFNVRDTGGYPADGGTIRANALLRGDSLHKLSQADQKCLIEAGVRTVIDLRHAREVDTAVNVFQGSTTMHYHHVSIFEAQPDAANADIDLPTLYRHMVDSCQSKLLHTLQTIALAPEGGVLVHCAGGKDRTGVVTALALSVAGVPRGVIVSDYALTTEAMKRMRPRLLANTALSPEALARIDNLLGSEPEWMTDLLAYLDARYGSVEGYLTQIGFSTDDRALLRNRLIEVQ